MSDFKVKIETDKYCGNILSVTQNGYQWTGLSIKTDDDIQEVIAVLIDFIEKKKQLEQSNES